MFSECVVFFAETETVEFVRTLFGIYFRNIKRIIECRRPFGAVAKSLTIFRNLVISCHRLAFREINIRFRWSCVGCRVLTEVRARKNFTVGFAHIWRSARMMIHFTTFASSPRIIHFLKVIFIVTANGEAADKTHLPFTTATEYKQAIEHPFALLARSMIECAQQQAKNLHLIFFGTFTNWSYTYR